METLLRNTFGGCITVYELAATGYIMLQSDEVTFTVLANLSNKINVQKPLHAKLPEAQL